MLSFMLAFFISDQSGKSISTASRGSSRFSALEFPQQFFDTRAVSLITIGPYSFIEMRPFIFQAHACR